LGGEAATQVRPTQFSRVRPGSSAWGRGLL